MDGENNGTPELKIHDLGGFPPIFVETSIWTLYHSERQMKLMAVRDMYLLEVKISSTEMFLDSLSGILKQEL